MVAKQRILIVDDDENIAELISLYLTKECFETKIVYDGESALDNLSTFKPNLILLDLMLPGIDGYQVCREIRKNNNTPIIMLSAKGETHEEYMDYHNIHVVYTKEAETADHYIEKFAHENGKKYNITVATSDGLEQVIIRGAGCLLYSAREFEKEVKAMEEHIRSDYLNRTY